MPSFLSVSYLGNFLSHPSVSGPRSLVNKQAPERSREPATSWKSEATRLSTKTLSFQEGMTESEQWPWLSISSYPTFPALFLSAPLSSCPNMPQAVERLGPPLLARTRPPCLWHVPQDFMCPPRWAESSFLSSSEKNACQEVQLFRECEIQYFNGAIFHVPLEKGCRAPCWSICKWVLFTLTHLPDFDITNSWYFSLPQRDCWLQF